MISMLKVLANKIKDISACSSLVTKHGSALAQLLSTLKVNGLISHKVLLKYPYINVVAEISKLQYIYRILCYRIKHHLKRKRL